MTNIPEPLRAHFPNLNSLQIAKLREYLRNFTVDEDEDTSVKGNHPGLPAIDQ